MAKETLKNKVYKAMQEMLPKYPDGLSPTESANLIKSEKYPDALHHSIVSYISVITKDHPNEFYQKVVEGKTLYFSGKNSASKSDSVMTKETSKSKIIAATEKVLKKHSDGLRWGELFNRVKAVLEGSFIPDNTIWSVVSTILKTDPDKFINEAEPGEKYTIYAIKNTKKSSTKKKASKASKSKTAPQTPKYSEKEYYQPFANYLMNGNGESDAHPECTTAIPLGGNKFGKKWETPDVVGVFRKQGTEVVYFSPEIISAEIKKDNSDLITAFGQACAYRLFSHKTYIVIPDSRAIANIERLCQIFGIGLVYFDPSETPHESMFSLKLPAQKHSPDMFYVNQKIAIVAKELGML